MLRWSKRWEDWYRRALPAYWMCLFTVTHFPKLRLGGPAQSDKIVHVVAFGLLAFLYWRFAETFGRPLSGRFVWQAALVLGAYAGLDEYLQQYVGRNTNWLDFAANLLGIALVLGVLELRRRMQRPAKEPGVES